MKGKGINKSKVINVSKIKNEPKWMRDFRINSYLKFEELPNPSFGPELQIDFDDITYYKKVGESQNDWNKVPKDIKEIDLDLTIYYSNSENTYKREVFSVQTRVIL